jgi:hypothetical protein
MNPPYSGAAAPVGSIDWQTKVKARILTGLLVGDNERQWSKFSRQIAVDLKTDADLNKCWSSPSHVRPPWP